MLKHLVKEVQRMKKTPQDVSGSVGCLEMTYMSACVELDRSELTRTSLRLAPPFCSKLH